MALAAMAVALIFSASAAQAQSTCDPANFKNPDGSFDLTGYLACVQGTSEGQNGNGNEEAAATQSVSGALPRTGTETGRYVAIGSALVLLGGAAVVGSTRARRAATVKNDD